MKRPAYTGFEVLELLERVVIFLVGIAALTIVLRYAVYFA